MEKLTKTANGQWRLQKVNDEVRNRRMQQVGEMQTKGQGDVKGNAGESIFNIPKEAKNFNPDIHLFHPNASDEFHRMDQDQWIDHSTKMLNDPRLNSDQLYNIKFENQRRDAIINQDHDAREAEEKRQKQVVAAMKRHGAQWEKQKDETDEAYKDRLIRENPRKAVALGFLHASLAPDNDPNKVMDFSADAIAERNQHKQENITEVQKAMLKKWQDDRNVFHNQALKFKDKLVDSIRRGSPETKAKIEKYLHIVPVKDGSGNVVDFSFEKKNHPKENLDQFLGLASQESDEQKQSNQSGQMGLDWDKPNPVSSDDQRLISPDNVTQAGTGVGVGRVFSPQEKKQMIDRAAGLNAPVSPEELQAAREKSERERKRIANEIEQARTVQAAAEKYK